MKINVNNSKEPCQSKQVFVLSTFMVLVVYLTHNFLILIFDILIFPYYFIYILNYTLKQDMNKYITS